MYLLAETNDSAARMAGRYRDHLVDHQVVDDTATVPLGDGNRVGAGDLVVTRRNQRDLTADGRFVANRDVWRVIEVHPDGAINGTRARPKAPATTAAANPAPGGATHPAQAETDWSSRPAMWPNICGSSTPPPSIPPKRGTRDVAHAVISERADRHGLYVALTRGRVEQQLGLQRLRASHSGRQRRTETDSRRPPGRAGVGRGPRRQPRPARRPHRG